MTGVQVSQNNQLSTGAGSDGRGQLAQDDHADDVPSERITHMADNSKVLDPAEQQQVSTALEHDAEVMTNTALTEQLAGQPKDVQAEIIRINTDARPIALQVALLVPILAGLLGLFISFRMMRQPDPVSSGAAEGIALG